MSQMETYVTNVETYVITVWASFALNSYHEKLFQLLKRNVYNRRLKILLKGFQEHEYLQFSLKLKKFLFGVTLAWYI